MNQFQSTSTGLTDLFHLRNIFEIVQVYRQFRVHLILAFYNYRSLKQYKEEGFGSFKEGFSFFRSVTGFEEFKINTIWKYSGVIDCYARLGYKPENIISYPISRLISLKPFLSRLMPGELEQILQSNKPMFENYMVELRERR